MELANGNSRQTGIGRIGRHVRMAVTVLNSLLKAQGASQFWLFGAATTCLVPYHQGYESRMIGEGKDAKPEIFEVLRSGEARTFLYMEDLLAFVLEYIEKLR